GTAIAKVLSDKGDEVRLYTRRADLAAAIEAGRENRRYLPGAPLGPGLHATSDLEHALRESDLVVVAVPSDALRGVMQAARRTLPPDVPIVSATKGIENESLMLMREVMIDVIGASVAD